jgi:LytR cell envelope-related transcriptional attenuator
VDLIEQIGAFLGLAAFIGLAILSMLYFQQGREVRRLRDWAGRAPERAEAAAEAAAAEIAGEPQEEEAEKEEAAGPSRRERLRGWLDGQMERLRLPGEIGERLPDPRILAVIAAGAIIAGVGVATGGFGLGDEDEKADKAKRAAVRPAEVEVAVLNGTSTSPGEPGVPGLAAKVGDEVKEVGYKVGPVTDTGTPFAESIVMYDDGHEAEAKQVAKDVAKQLGNTTVGQMTGEVKQQAGGAGVALVIGQDDSQV